MRNPTGIPADQLQAWQAEGVIEWWGHRDDMQRTLRAANLVVLPSYREGFPKVLLEAAASGRVTRIPVPHPMSSTSRGWVISMTRRTNSRRRLSP